VKDSDEVVCEAAEDALRELLTGDGSMELFVVNRDSENEGSTSEQESED
jgi:hypothetical protein